MQDNKGGGSGRRQYLFVSAAAAGFIVDAGGTGGYLFVWFLAPCVSIVVSET